MHKIHKADLSLTPEQWRASLSPEEKKDGRKVLEQLDKIWTRRESYPIELEIQWEQLTENEYNYLIYELKNEESLESLKSLRNCLSPKNFKTIKKSVTFNAK